jgi:hypothetical protein
MGQFISKAIIPIHQKQMYQDYPLPSLTLPNHHSHFFLHPKPFIRAGAGVHSSGYRHLLLIFAAWEKNSVCLFFQLYQIFSKSFSIIFGAKNAFRRILFWRLVHFYYQNYGKRKLLIITMNWAITKLNSVFCMMIDLNLQSSCNVI